jgi:hypothetical protein
LEDIEVAGATIQCEGGLASGAFDIDDFRGASDHRAKANWTRCASDGRGLRRTYSIDLIGLGHVDSGITKGRTLVLHETSG